MEFRMLTLSLIVRLLAPCKQPVAAEMFQNIANVLEHNLEAIR